jgi:hypothetical protein
LFGEALYYVYVALSEVEYAPYFIWYRSPSFIFWIATGSLIALFIFGHTRLTNQRINILKWAPAAVSLAIYAVATGRQLAVPEGRICSRIGLLACCGKIRRPRSSSAERPGVAPVTAAASRSPG